MDNATLNTISLCSGVAMKPIPGFHGRYSATEDGLIFSHISNRFLKQSKTGEKGTYLQVSLGKAHKSLSVHRLVLLTFRGPCPEGMESRHLNGNGHDNRLINLDWSTHSVNVLDKTLHGTAAIGEKHHCCAISDADVTRLKNRRRQGVSYPELGREFGISKSQAHRIVTGQHRRGGEIE